jgi:hypothetical protein
MKNGWNDTKNRPKKPYKLKFYKVVAGTMLTYENQNWAVDKTTRKDQSAGMRFLCP